VLGKTLGVPLFQEQAMKLAIVAAEFTPSEANQLRRAMATFRNLGMIDAFRDKLVGGMVRRGYEQDFAERCFKQIEGFGSYGFPESHAIAFARLVWVSSWIKHHYPAVFSAALLNSQPMGFYAPAQIVRDAREHGVAVLPIDVNESFWNNAVDRRVDGALAMRLGMRQMSGFREDWADAIAARRPFASVEELARKAVLPSRALKLLADADAFRSIALDRREALWDVRRTPTDELPLFAAARARELGAEEDMALPTMHLGEHVVADYQTIRLSLKTHPMALLRPVFRAEHVLSCAELMLAKAGARVAVAGFVLVRQRPGNGKAIFVTLEDESGVANIIMWARTFETQRRAVMASRLMQVAGEVQRSPEGIVHLMAHRITERNGEMERLSDQRRLDPQLSRADEFVHPQHPRVRHPRDVRIFPKSRDFH
jgi:error-prone DNA polymerase